jgi:hypothetical protein
VGRFREAEARRSVRLQKRGGREGNHAIVEALEYLSGIIVDAGE